MIKVILHHVFNSEGVKPEFLNIFPNIIKALKFCIELHSSISHDISLVTENLKIIVVITDSISIFLQRCKTNQPNFVEEFKENKDVLDVMLKLLLTNLTDSRIFLVSLHVNSGIRNALNSIKFNILKSMNIMLYDSEMNRKSLQLEQKSINPLYFEFSVTCIKVILEQNILIFNQDSIMQELREVIICYFLNQL